METELPEIGVPSEEGEGLALSVPPHGRAHRHRHRRRRKRRRVRLQDVLLILLGLVVVVGAIVKIVLDLRRQHTPPTVLVTIGDGTITNRDLDHWLEDYFHSDSLDHIPVLTPQFAAYAVEEMQLDDAALMEAGRLGLDAGVAAAPDAAGGPALPPYGRSARTVLGELRALVTNGLQASPGEVRDEYLRLNQRVKIAYVYFDASRYGEAVQIGPGALDAYFADNFKRYKMPEQRSLHYVVIDSANSAELLQAWRDESNNGAREAPDSTWTGDAKAWLPEWIDQELRADPEHFDLVAAKLGLPAKETALFQYGQALPELAYNTDLTRRAFDLAAEDVTEPVSVGGSLIIARLGRVSPAHGQVLSEVHDRVEHDYRQEWAHLLIEQKAHELALKAQVSGFRTAAAALGLAVNESSEFSMLDKLDNRVAGSSLGDAFELQPGQTSGVVPVGADRVVFQVLSKAPAGEEGFAAQRAGIEAQLLVRKRDRAWQLYRHHLRQQLADAGEITVNPLAVQQAISDYGSD